MSTCLVGLLATPQNRETSRIYDGTLEKELTIMIPTFVLLASAGGLFRLGLNIGLRRKLGVSLALPPVLALAILLLTILPDMITPIDINLPLGLVVGLLLPDLLLRRFGDGCSIQGSKPRLHCPDSSLR
jgi:hypothetical protein